MPAAALLLGDPGPAPFAGHLRLVAEGESAWIAVAGQLAAESGPAAAWEPARRLEAALREALAVRTRDRHLLLRRAWEALAALPADALGAAGGADLSLLLVAGDDAGVGVAGVGLSAVWARFDKEWAPIAEGDHPLLAPPGRPPGVPGVLTLPSAPAAVLAAPAHQHPRLPPLGQIDARAGVRA